MQMKPFKTITDPEAAQLMADETRRQIIFLLRAKEMTVGKIAEELGKTPQAIYHQINMLDKHGLVEVSREERVGHLIESYYRSTAEVFYFVVGPEMKGQSMLKAQLATAVGALSKLGFNLEVSDKDMERLMKMQLELENCCGKADFEERVSNMEDVDFLTKEMVMEYAATLAMTDEEFHKQQRLQADFRDAIKSLLKKK